MSFLRHGESIDPMNVYATGSKQSGSLPVLIGLDEFQPAIPRQVALQQSLPPLRRPRTILQNKTPPYNDLSATGNNPLNSVSHHKGSLHPSPAHLCTSLPRQRPAICVIATQAMRSVGETQGSI
jgi:hypothetical protein